MIISEKQIMELINIAGIYLNALEQLYKFDQSLLTNAGLHNKKYIADFLTQITTQQSEQLKEISDD
jgi:hypothetical protein